jgi:hydrogenase 3 maturation protease
MGNIFLIGKRDSCQHFLESGEKKLTSPLAVWKRRLSKEIGAADRIVVLAVGNKSKRDDAAGLLCAEGLKKLLRGKALRSLKIVLGFEAPENMTGEIRKFNPDLVLILDAADGQYEPGSIFIVEKDRIKDEGVSTHKISLALLASYLEETVGCNVTVLGIQPLDLGFGEDVSERVKKSAAEVAAYLAHIFRGMSG